MRSFALIAPTCVPPTNDLAHRRRRRRRLCAREFAVTEDAMKTNADMGGAVDDSAAVDFEDDFM